MDGITIDKNKMINISKLLDKQEENRNNQLNKMIINDCENLKKAFNKLLNDENINDGYMKTKVSLKIIDNISDIDKKCNIKTNEISKEINKYTGKKNRFYLQHGNDYIEDEYNLYLNFF
jgi:tRNA U54 and U55 pseudouridine synthase Pus10